MKRRNFLIRFILGSIGLLIADVFWFEKSVIDWNEFDLSDGQAERLKIIQLSDLHLNEIQWKHKQLARRITSEKPDLLVLTGDVIDRNRQLPVLREFLDLIDRDCRKIAILGNREYEGEIDLTELTEIYKYYGIHLLVNETLVHRKGDRRINVMGLDDLQGGSPDFMAAANTAESEADTLILNHCPAYRDTIEEINKELKLPLKMILSGHTHGGQIAFFGKAIYTPLGSGRYERGWYTSQESKMYVSKGIGTRALPVRFGARAEAGIFYM